MAVSGVVSPAFAARTAPVRKGLQVRVAVAGALVCAGAVAVSSTNASSDGAFGQALLEFLIVGVPIAAGLYALQTPLNARFGLALLAIGFAWSLTALAESSVSAIYTIGWLSTWLIFPCVVYLLLTFPDGRIAQGLDRGLLVGVLVLAAVLFFGTSPFVKAYPQHTLWTSCTTNCPANAVFLLHHQPALMFKLILVREWLVGALWIGLFCSMARRWRAASPLLRLAIGPAFLAAAVLGLSHIAFYAARELNAPGQTLVTLSSVWAVCIVGLCAAFVFGLVRRRMVLAGSLGKLGLALRQADDPTHVRDALATALSDSTTELLFRDPASGTWHDALGCEADWPPPAEPGRAVTEIGPDGAAPEVVLTHDVALRDDPELLEAASGMVLAGWRHEQLTSDLARAMSDLEDSRRRIAKAADLERARIERDLHDGAQQRLIALRIRLSLAEETLETDPAAGLQELRALGFEADRALDELRTLAHGVYPSLLTDRGILDALRAVARQASVPVQVAARGVTRQPMEIESAVYFTCTEALQNAMKHAPTATGIQIRISQSPTALRFEVIDNGPGFSGAERNGRGLRNMRDRIEAIGGRFTVTSDPGRGTQVRGTVDLPEPRSE
jgi:signal transduction histidine kinase